MQVIIFATKRHFYLLLAACVFRISFCVACRVCFC